MQEGLIQPRKISSNTRHLKFLQKYCKLYQLGSLSVKLQSLFSAVGRYFQPFSKICFPYFVFYRKALSLWGGGEVYKTAIIKH